MELIENEITNHWELWIGDCKFCCFDTLERAELGRDLMSDLIEKAERNVGENELYRAGLSEAVAITERELITNALIENGYNKSAAARALKMKRTTLIEKYKKYERGAKKLIELA